ncbi:MAG TPA: response regulator [Thermomicrobiales bacterium]
MDRSQSVGVAPHSQSAPMGARHTQRRRILVVDDDAAIRELLCDLLDSEGYEVAEATNGAEAVEAVRANPPAAVLMDLMMPICSGAEATAILKGDPRTAHVPILAMSAGRNLASIAGDIPVDGFVAKPFDLTALIATLDQHTRRAS